MVSRTGANTFLGLKLGSTFGTAEALGTDDKLLVENLTHGKSTEELRANPIGSGNDMDEESAPGATSPFVQFEKIMNYDDAGVAALAQFMGSCSVNTAGSGAYTHSLIYNETRNQRYATVAFHGYSAGVFEYPSVAFHNVQIEAASPPNYVLGTFDGLADEQVISGTENDEADLTTVTIADSTRVIAKPQDLFQINVASGGALSGSDNVAVTSVSLELDYPLEHAREIKGSSGNGEPISTGEPPLSATLTIQLRNLADFTWFTAQNAETEYKARLLVSGATIGGGNDYEFAYYLPRLKVIQDPEYNLASAAENPSTVVFKGLVAASAPTGMISTYPYFLIQNTRSSSYFS